MRFAGIKHLKAKSFSLMCSLYSTQLLQFIFNLRKSKLKQIQKLVWFFVLQKQKK